jgi:hypothetical protein
VTPTEEAMAAALVRAGERFHYEPRTFRIHHPNGKLSGFNPDFYLPEHELYIEVGNPAHKRVKVRWCRAAYPNLQVVIVANEWREEILGLSGEAVIEWLREKWVEQEYSDAYSLHRRHQAREEARWAKQRGIKGPSLRCA